MVNSPPKIDQKQNPATTESVQHQRQRRIKPRKFYLLQGMPYSTASGWKLLNGAELFRGTGTGILTPPSPFERGFRDYPARPRFHFRRLGRNANDFKQHGEYWLVSDRAKNVLSSVSEADFKFLAVDTEVEPGKEPMVMWLCDIMPVLDAVDEARSVVDIAQSSDGRRIHLISGLSKLFFDGNVIASHHAFRLTTNYHTCVCDEAIKAAVKEAGLTGLSFRDASKSY